MSACTYLISILDSADASALRFEEAGVKIALSTLNLLIGRAVVVENPWGNRQVLLGTSKGLLVKDEERNEVSDTIR